MASTLLDVLSGSPSAPALVLCGGGHVIQRQALRSAVEDLAARLIASGLKPNQTVSLAFENNLEYVVSFLAVTWARGVAAPLNAAYKGEEHRFYLEDGQAVLLLLPTSGNAAALEAAKQLGVPVAHVHVELQVQGNLSWAGPGSRTLPQPPRPSDVALFLHTSGTTGRPKGVPLSHANLTASLANITATYDLGPADVSYLVMPLFHVHGLMAGFLAPLAAGGSVVLPAAGRFTASTFWPDCCAHKVTFYTAVPTIHQVLLARAAKDYPVAHPPPLRFIRSCSSALAPATLARLEATFKVPVLEAYAMTEASHQMTSNPLPRHGPHKPGTVGKAQGGVSVAILDPANRLLPVGEVGEVCIRGPNVTPGYHNNPKANEEAFAGGWFHTGDQGYLDPEGYVTLTGRLKELINRGGEKISPLEVDACLLSHPLVAEAVSFGAPDDKYGEVVAAAVVLKPGAAREGVEAAVREHCRAKLAAFKVPSMVFVTESLPKTATGKIQRRHMVTAFIKPGAGTGAAGGGTPASGTPTTPPSSTSGSGDGKHHESISPAPVAGVGDGYELTARALAALGVTEAYGVIGIPVTPFASSLQAAGIRFIAFRNEQAAGYAAASAGFLAGRPALLLTVSGPGAIHGIAGLSHAKTNCWPLIMIAGSCEQADVGKGGFQEVDQVAALAPYCKYAVQADGLAAIPSCLAAAVRHATSGRPGACYVDIPSNVFMRQADPALLRDLPALTHPGAPSPTSLLPLLADQLASVAQLLRGAQRPLMVVGKGAALGRAEEAVKQLAEQCDLPVLTTSMGRGVLPDQHPLCVNAARSSALKGADLVLVVGARLNWQLHFGEAPRWSGSVRFVLVDPAPSDRDAALAACCLKAPAAQALHQLAAVARQGAGAATGPANVGEERARDPTWVKALQGKAEQATRRLAARIAAAPHSPLEYFGVMGALDAALAPLLPAPVLVSEGANTMDMARLILTAKAPRTRLDAGTWGTMGVGLGGAIAAATATCSPALAPSDQAGAGRNSTGVAPRLVVAVEGDSAFGFSGMECETMVRYRLPILVVVMNNGGIYGGDRRTAELQGAAATGAHQAGFAADPIPTAFAPTRYNDLMASFGGMGLRATSLPELRERLGQGIAHCLSGQGPALLDVVLDPMAGVESGNVHAFNAPQSKL